MCTAPHQLPLPTTIYSGEAKNITTYIFVVSPVFLLTVNYDIRLTINLNPLEEESSVPLAVQLQPSTNKKYFL